MITLHPHQQRAAAELVAILRTHRIAYLAGEVRSGKSLTALEVVRQMGYTSALIVTKKKAIASIEKDRNAMYLAGTVTVTNYEQLPRHSGKSYGIIIVDEAHGVGSYPKPSKRYKDLQAIHRSAVLLMSGTPSPESFSQLFHQFKLGPAPWGQYRSFYQWANDYVIVKQKYVGTGQKVNDYSGAIEAKVLADIRPLTVTMTQAEAGITTKITEHVHMVKMKPRTYRLAGRILKDGVIGNPKGRAVVADTGAKAASKLQQIYGGAVITERHGAVKFDDSKARFVGGMFSGTKHAILYRFNAEGDMLKSAYGGAWTDSPELFNTDPSLTYIGQVQSSREGVNLSSAEHLIFVGIDFAALSYLQAKDRASYIGRTKANNVHWIFAHGGIEPRIYQTVKGKIDYTKRHFDHDRKQMAIDADQAVRERGMACVEVDPVEQGGLPRLVAAEAERGEVRGGQGGNWQDQQSTGLPDSRTAVCRL